MGRALGQQSNRCLMFHRRMRACMWGMRFFSNFTSYLSDQRGAIGLLIPHTGGKSQSASLLNMAAAGYIYRHTSAYGKAITAQSRVQSRAARAPSDCWQMCCGIWKDGGLLLPHLDLHQNRYSYSSYSLFLSGDFVQGSNRREDLLHFPTELQNAIKSDCECFLFVPLVYIYCIFSVPTV